MRLFVAIIVLAVGLGAAAWVLSATAINPVVYAVLLAGVTAAAPLGVPSWVRRHPDRCVHCRGRGSNTFIAARRLRTRHCFFCHGTGRLDA
ncbi:hypothetical protein [Cryptosporangium phraense]|uniref:Uncharacterized protein n=1 Tax=Cryptosporangium phraense TaxID=2593070 RepID=A0A545AWZ6_9ACTN|nr:hypothetical protein [Cryptosporangium phraense]TQS45852.1 hypothetical protein FL583_04850 [Cryptosporangium phraense]